MRSRSRQRLVSHIVAFSFYLSLFPWPGVKGVPEAEAKVSPLHMITRQVKKGNMLVVLDTSGSMTGVPGEPFDANTELGVDCDLGENCREVSQTGQCLQSVSAFTGQPRMCSNDAQCRVGSCKFGNDPCLQDFDCPSVGSICSLNGKPCQYNADCGPQAGTCKLTGLGCSSVTPCPLAGKCSDTNAICNNPGGQCAVRYCSDKPTQSCTADADCQAATPPQAPPTTGLQVYWKYDEAAGTTTVTDHAGGDNTGTYNASPWRGPGVGTGSSINCSDPDRTRVTTNVQLGNTVTISTWYYRTGSNDNKLIDWAGGYDLAVWSDNQFGLILGNNYSTWPRVSGASILQNTWTHLAATWNGSVAKLYINGALVSTQSISQTIAAQNKELLVCGGLGPNLWNPTDGRIDNTRIYNTVLTDAEVQAIFTGENTASASGLFGHWKLDGNGTDSSGNGSNFTLNSPVYAAGQVGQALNTATSGNSVNPNSANSLDKATNKFTMAAWVYRDGATIAANEGLIHRQINAGIQYFMDLTPGRDMYTYIYSSGGLIDIHTPVFSANAWHHVASTWDGTTGTLNTYLDGAKVNTATTSPGTLAGTSGSLYLGSSDGAGANKLNGLLDDVRLYNKVLTDAEISQLAGGTTAGLVAHLNFDNNVTDQTGNGFNGVREGTTNYVAGPVGQALSLDGTSGCVQIPAAQGSMADIRGPFSVAYFVYRETNVDHLMVHRRLSASWNPSVSMTTETTPPRFTTWIRNDVNQMGAPDEILSIGAWHHVTLTWDNTALRYYQDGVQVNVDDDVPAPDATPESNGNPWYIGCASQGGTQRHKWANIRVDDFRVYDKAISATEVAALSSAGGVAAAPQGLIGHWKFDEGTGASITDQSAGGNTLQLWCTDGTAQNPNQTGTSCLNGMPQWNPGHTGGAADKSSQFLFFQYGEVASSALNGKLTNQVTLSAWVKKTLSGANRWIVHQEIPGSGYDALGLWFKTGLNLGIRVDDGGGTSAEANDPTPASVGQWYHVVGSYDGAALKLYKDGVLVATTPLVGFTFPANTSPLTIGAGTEDITGKRTEFLDGMISEVAIWNKALTAPEVTALMAGTAPAGSSAFCKTNVCNDLDNACNTALNVCQGGQVNECGAVSTTDLCVINQSNVGPAKMCRLAQVFCAVDANCLSAPNPYQGDECVPATSRAVVAKRVLKNVLLNNSDIMNFGMMAFSQGSADGTTWDRVGNDGINAADKDGWPDDYYFPYFKVKTNGGGTAYEDRYFPLDELNDFDCYDPDTGPKPSCVIGPITYTLRPSNTVNARYTVFMNGGFVQVDQPWCGDKCVVSTISQGWLFYEKGPNKNTDARGTGRFAGALYTYPVASGDYEAGDQPTFLQSFKGRTTQISGEDYIYFKPRDDYYWNPQAGSNRPAIKGAQCGDKCSVECGGNWDQNLIPLLDTSDVPATSKANIAKMLPMLDKARDGGFMHFGPSPVGCALINDFATGATPAPADKKKSSAWNYLEDIRATDPIPCRDDFVLLITDGESSGPGDVDALGNSTCDNLDCRVQWDDPNATVGATCQCKSVINALKLRQSIAKGGLNVKTYVIGFSPDSNIGAPGMVNENIARAGGTCRSPYDNTSNPNGDKDRCLFLANNETELQAAIQAVIFDAIKGSYSTSPSSAISGVQVDAKKITPGGVLFDARVDFPSWKGHLLAYDTAVIDAVSLQPKLLWDAGSPSNFPDLDDPMAFDQEKELPVELNKWRVWTKRHIYTSGGSNMVKFSVDEISGAVLNRDELLTMGLGNTAEEAERVAQWLMGDPRQRNKAALGAFVNSTPIEVGPAGLSPLPGGKRFFDDQKNRVSLVYAASDDGMLHAFFTRETVVNGRRYKGGEEAFAYIPPEMLRAVTDLYSQGGQKADPRQHVFGLTSSPKMKNVCWSNCDDDATAVWKSIMIMSDGWGGTESFMLDVTNPFVAGNFASPPIQLMWHTDTVMPADKTLYDDYQGRTVSVPAFYYGKSTNKDDYRVVYASGYRSKPPTSSAQGITLMNVSARNGALLDADVITPANCPNIELTALTDVASARNYDYREQQQMLGAFFGDTWGNLWRYIPTQVGPNNNTGSTGTMSLVKAFGCNQPLHFAPAIVQLDRDDPLNHPGDVYVVQATNSALDPETDAFAPSKLIIRKETRTSSTGGIAPDNTWTAGGQLEYVAGDVSLCGVWDPTGNAGAGACTEVLPLNARPTGTPLVILKADGTGFLVMSIWYSPATNICGFGRSYLLLHTMDVGGKVMVQKAGIGLANEAITSAVIVDKKVVYTDSQGKVHDVTSQLNQTFVSGGAISDTTRNGGLRFQQTGWMEVP